jgi:hypothetical protein
MRFLLDYHISPRVAGAFKRMGGKAEVLPMRDWHGGACVQQHGESDLPWLRVAGREGWVVVTDDRNTLLGELALLWEEGGALPGIAVVGSEHQADIGWIADRLMELEKRLAHEEPGNVQVFL